VALSGLALLLASGGGIVAWTVALGGRFKFSAPVIFEDCPAGVGSGTCLVLNLEQATGIIEIVIKQNMYMTLVCLGFPQQ
jgi:hypothetical protein